MKRRMSICCAVVVTLLGCALAFRPGPTTEAKAGAHTALETVSTVPLFVLHNDQYAYFYTADPNEMAALQGKPDWHYRGICCYVIPNSAKVPGSVGMYRLTKQAKSHEPLPLPDKTYSKFFYTTDKKEADNAVSNLGWRLEGVAFYVSPKPVPNTGTVELFRFYEPYWEAKAPIFTGKHGDHHFYTVNKKDWRDKDFVRVEAYVWGKQIALDAFTGLVAAGASAPAAPNKPDLVVQKTFADSTSVTALLRNQGKLNTGGVKYEVALLIYDKRNNLLARLVQTAPGLSPNQTMPVKFDTTGKGPVGKRYQVVIDEPNTVKESNENNNATEITDGPPPRLKPVDSSQQTSIPLALDLRNRSEVMLASGQLQKKFTAYDLVIINAGVFPEEAYKQQLTALAPAQCGAKPSSARLFAEIVWGREGKDTQPVMSGACIPLASPQDLAKMSFTIPVEKGTANLLRVIVRDRLTGFEHKSNVYPVGAFGVSKALFTVGCKGFLGRADDILCTTTAGMAACENLRQQGKPIQCRMAK